MDKDCLQHLYNTFKVQAKDHGIPDHKIDYEWNRMPDKIKQEMIDMVLSYKPGTNSPLMAEIMAEYNKKTHSDLSFGMIVKQLINKHK